jgi:diadenosine tetraphosphatase ApaH/serine/threonine PP2A family protein phosphatase
VYAIISDLHSNLEALTAVLDDMAAYPIEKIFCLGDAIGYGPSPREVLQIVKRCEFILMGNHEEGLLYFAKDFNPRAKAALDWTRDQLNDPTKPKGENYDLWQMLDDLPKVKEAEGALFVHGSLREETRDYVLPGDIRDKKKMGEIFSKMSAPVCFFGHTHIPGVWTESGKFLRPDEAGEPYVVPSEKVVINVGSVGQPRDGDNRSCYVIVDGDQVIFRRVKYDYITTMQKILATDMLSEVLAERLKVGK